MANTDNRKKIIAIGSCKGGVGKTTVAINLAMALRRTGSTVGLFDADLYGPNVPLMLGLRIRQNKTPFSLTSKQGQSISFLPLYNSDPIEPLTKYGLKVMSLGLWFSERNAAADPAFLGGQLIAEVLRSVVWGDLEYLIIDLPPGTGELLKTILTRAGVDSTILVTTPQEMALLDTGRSIEFFQSMNIDILGRIENMSYLQCPNCNHHIDVYSSSFDDWQVLQDIPLLGSIPLDRDFSRPIDGYHPFTQVEIDTPKTRPYLEIAQQLKEWAGQDIDEG